MKDIRSSEPSSSDRSSFAYGVRRLLGWLIAAVLFFMMILTVVDVIGRFIFTKPVPGSFELMEFSLAIVVFSALPLVTWDRGHITASLFDGFFRRHGYRLQQIIMQLSTVIGMGIICWRMWDQGVRLDQTEAVTGFLEWPVAPIAFFMSVFAGLSFLLTLILLWNSITGKPYPEFPDHTSEFTS